KGKWRGLGKGPVEADHALLGGGKNVVRRRHLQPSETPADNKFGSPHGSLRAVGNDAAENRKLRAHNLDRKVHKAGELIVSQRRTFASAAPHHDALDPLRHEPLELRSEGLLIDLFGDRKWRRRRYDNTLEERGVGHGKALGKTLESASAGSTIVSELSR